MQQLFFFFCKVSAKNLMLNQLTMADSNTEKLILGEDLSGRLGQTDGREINEADEREMLPFPSTSQPLLESKLANQKGGNKEPCVRRSRRLMGHHRRSWKSLRHKSQRTRNFTGDEQFSHSHLNSSVNEGSGNNLNETMHANLSNNKADLDFRDANNSNFGMKPNVHKKTEDLGRKHKKQSFLSSNEMMEDSEFWTLLRTALNESSGDSENSGTDNDISVIRQAMEIAEDKSYHTSLHKTPQLFDHYEVLKHNAQEFDKYSVKDADGNLFKCKACDQNYVCSTALTRHMKTHVCGTCNQFFVAKTELLDHKWAHRADHAKDIRDSVKNLPVRYTISSKNRTVISRCTSRNVREKKYHCKPCDLSFNSNDTLMRHMITHVCKQCDAFFSDKTKLKIHKRDHRDGNISALSDNVTEDTLGEKEVVATTTILEDKNKKIGHYLETSVVPDVSLAGTFPSNNLIIAMSSSTDSMRSSSVSLPQDDDKSMNSSDLQQNLLEMIGVTVSNKYIVTIVPTNSICPGISTQVSDDSSSIVASETISLNQETQNQFSKLGQFILSSSSAPSAKQILNESSSHDEKERNFACSVCGKKFLSKGNLKGHIEIHSDMRGYSCSECEKSFRRKHTLEKHKKTHLK